MKYGQIYMIIVLPLLLFHLQLSEVSKPRMNKQEAIKQARSACKRLGIELRSEPTSVKFIDNIGVPGDTYWSPRWQISFKEALVTISDGSGEITNFLSQLPGTRSNEPTPDDIELPENGLAQKAMYMTKLLAVQEINRSRYERISGGQVNSKPDRTITFVWKRRYEGYEYQNQHFTMSLDTFTGKMIGFGVVFRTPHPVTQTETITSKKAIQIASDFLKTLKVEFQPNPEIIKRIVANGKWDEEGNNWSSVKPAVVAWTMKFIISDKKWANVYVDAHDGRIVGDSLDGYR